MAKVTYSKTVSDAHLRVVLQRMADVYGRDIAVHSGDRDTIVKGSSSKSLHVAHRAADFHMGGLSDGEVFSSSRDHLAKIFDTSEGYEFILHGTHTNTGGPHLHLGHYPGRNQGKVMYKTEGMTPGSGGDYHVTPVSIPTGGQPLRSAPSQVTTRPLNTISQSVGDGGVNEKSDVKIVQKLINSARSRLIAAGRAFEKFNVLKEDGICGRFTIGAIIIFQRDVMGMKHPDGNVGPNGPTIRALKGISTADVPKVIPTTHPSSPTMAPASSGGVTSSSSPQTLVQDGRIKAMLDVLGFTEGTGTNYGKVCNGTVLSSPYFPNLVGQRNVSITDLSRHPNILVRVNASLNSTAAGRYQFLTSTWNELNMPDFTAPSQDIAAVKLMRRRRMLAPLLQGNWRQAVYNGAPEWASLPTQGGGSYYGGQPARTISEIESVYLAALRRYQGTT